MTTLDSEDYSIYTPRRRRWEEGRRRWKAVIEVRRMSEKKKQRE